MALQCWTSLGLHSTLRAAATAGPPIHVCFKNLIAHTHRLRSCSLGHTTPIRPCHGCSGGGYDWPAPKRPRLQPHCTVAVKYVRTGRCTTNPSKVITQAQASSCCARSNIAHSIACPLGSSHNTLWIFDTFVSCLGDHVAAQSTKHTR